MPTPIIPEANISNHIEMEAFGICKPRLTMMLVKRYRGVTMVKITDTENDAGSIGIHFLINAVNRDHAAAASKISRTPRLNSTFPKFSPPAIVSTTPMKANNKPH